MIAGGSNGHDCVQLGWFEKVWGLRSRNCDNLYNLRTLINQNTINVPHSQRNTNHRPSEQEARVITTA